VHFFSEQKRQLKAQQKAQKAAVTPAPTTKSDQPAAAAAAAATENDDQDIDPNEYYKMRLHHIQQLKKAGETVYPHKYNVSIA
ncbi:unnamed protein product, partial [Rotaria magnacalcarata]